MKKQVLLAAGAALLVSAALGAVVTNAMAGSGDVKLESLDSKVSYSIGMQVGEGLTADHVNLDVAAFTAGVEDAIAKKDPRLTQDQIRETMMAFQQQQMEAMNKQAETNRAAGEAFLAANKKKKGVQTTASGLQYRVITAGKGKKPTPSDQVTVNYKGALIDGTEFDSSYKRNEPATFPVGGVIPGWVEALQLMQEGSKWEVVIPSDLAYGPRGQGGIIGPNAVLVFEVELIKVEAGAPAGANPHGH
ncbi:MAG: FKBP-type peptidyl-prolyl cis-trans isomerase [Nitrospirota bacterium]|nr:FKBP-type peptidyl-prolyl cis-trans isomerase [Nitrospirota bacterium]